VRDILRRHGREAAYVEVSLESSYRYNRLHNDVDAYALAYGIATLMTNLFGRGKEPFWQQASTNLVKFVILLHQTLDDNVTSGTEEPFPGTWTAPLCLIVGTALLRQLFTVSATT
jgi:fatty acid desaturase